MNDHRQHNWPEEEPGEETGQWPGFDEAVPEWPSGDEPSPGGNSGRGTPRWPRDDVPRGPSGPRGPNDVSRPPQYPPGPRHPGPPRGAPPTGPPQGQPGGQNPPWKRPERPQHGGEHARGQGGYPHTEQPTGYLPPVDDSPAYEPGLLTHDRTYHTGGHGDYGDYGDYGDAGYDDERPYEAAGADGDPDADDAQEHGETAHAHASGKRGKAGLTAKQRKRRRWRIVRRTLYAIFGIFFVLPALAFTIAYFIVDVPTPEQVAADQGQVITYTFSDGSTMGKVAPSDGGNRVILEPREVPDVIKHAAYAAEDASFESNPGFDVSSIMRAAWSQVTGGGGGGSTISQQYVKQATGADQHSYTRKFVEVVKSFKMNNEQSKSDIITGYLNTVYLGRGAYGVQAAAQAYFGTDVDELEPSQAALLAGMIQQPSRYDDQAYMKKRWSYVLDQMMVHQWLAPAKRKAAEFPDMIPIDEAGPKGITGPKAFIKRRVNAELAAKGYPEEKLQSGGYTVHTTIDPKAQKLAKQATQSVMEGEPTKLSESLVAVDPKSGAVRAYYGGPASAEDSADGAALARNPGSAFKPFDLVALLKSGTGLAKTYNGTSPREIAGHTIRNAGDSASCSATCTVATAMEVSANTVFVDMVANDVGPDAVIDAAHNAGIPTKYRGNPTMDHGFNIAIGGGDTQVTATQMASAYASFASAGIRHDKHFVAKLEDSSGELVYETNTEGEPAFAPQNPDLSKKIAGNVTKSLEPVLPHSNRTCPPGYDCAGKTGTDEATGNKYGTNQAWMVGYTPTISAAAWVGTKSGGGELIQNARGAPIYGRGLSGAIWEKFMQSYLPGTPKQQFPEVDPIGEPLQQTDPVDRDVTRGGRQEDTQSDSRSQQRETTTDTPTPPSDDTGESTTNGPTDTSRPSNEPPDDGNGGEDGTGDDLFNPGEQGNGRTPNSED